VIVKQNDDRKIIVPDLTKATGVYQTPAQPARAVETVRLEKQLKTVRAELEKLEKAGKLKESNKTYQVYKSIVKRLCKIVESTQEKKSNSGHTPRP